MGGLDPAYYAYLSNVSLKYQQTTIVNLRSKWDRERDARYLVIIKIKIMCVKRSIVSEIVHTKNAVNIKVDWE